MKPTKSSGVPLTHASSRRSQNAATQVRAPRTLLMWSGGLDSTYALVRLLRETDDDAALLTESYSCLTTALGRLGRRDGAATWRALRDAHDVTWRSDDPWPFLLMMVNTWRIVWLAASKRMSFTFLYSLLSN